MSDVELVESPQRRPNLARRLTGRARGHWFAHNSGRFDRPGNLWRAALTYLRRKSVLVTGTEAAGRDKALFRAALAGSDWSYAHLSGAAVGECYGTWDASVLRLFDKPWAHKLTDKTWVRSKEYGGKTAAKVHALILPLEVIQGRLKGIQSNPKFWIVVVHMPLDNTPARAEAWVDCCRGLLELEKTLAAWDEGAEVILVGDWNKNLRLPNERRAVQNNLLRRGSRRSSAVTNWDGRKLPRAGTHDRQVIDYAIGRRFLGCQLLRDLPDSDHRAFRYRVRT